MMKSIKREVRILGLDSCGRRLVGIVSRGGLYLDGAITFRNITETAGVELARNVRGTKYFPELKAIMIHDPEALLNLESLARITGLPILVAPDRLKRFDKSFRVLQSDHGRLSTSTETESSVTHEMLMEIWTVGKLPEPIRIAHLLSRLPAGRGSRGGSVGSSAVLA